MDSRDASASKKREGSKAPVLGDTEASWPQQEHQVDISFNFLCQGFLKRGHKRLRIAGLFVFGVPTFVQKNNFRDKLLGYKLSRTLRA